MNQENAARAAAHDNPYDYLVPVDPMDELQCDSCQ